MQAIFTSAANRDVKRGLSYYKREAGAKVAERFIDQIELAVSRLLKNPGAYRVVAKNLRCVNLDRFPYQVVYRIASQSIVKILSVRHHKQHPDFGLDR